MKTEFEVTAEIPDETEKEKIPESCIMVIFGASGDLTKRMLIPSLFKLYAQKLLPKNFTVVGYSRKEMDNKSFRESMQEGIKDFGMEETFSEDLWKEFNENLFYIPADFEDLNSYKNLKIELDKLDIERNIKGNRLLYMAVPPDGLPGIIENLGKSGLNKNNVSNNNNEEPWTRIILEKPFGHDLD
ncbi:MAG: hypothetical protein LH629_11005, partial [Ignavibacteria bacterium]|nr:hypothetical protein [Ignavibacteria bacterium]